jgi:aminocarboxymuconate-semialdehyde decarboxylase
MPTRREFFAHVGGAAAAAVLAGGATIRGAARQPQAAGKRREVMIGGRRIKTVDVHTHCYVAEALPIVQDQKWGNGVVQAVKGTPGNLLNPEIVGPERLADMDRAGIDMQILSINPFWYTADRDTARRLITVQNKALADLCKKYPGRFAAFATVALQYPDLAAEQLEEAMTQFGLCGAAIGGNIAGEELGSPKLDPYWAKAEKLQAFHFIHPQGNGRFDGRAYPAGFYERLGKFGGNIIGYPLETTLAFSHLIFDGTLDRFPGLKFCGAHGGGFLASYPARSDGACNDPRFTFCKSLKKKPSEYLKTNLYSDSLVFTTEGLRHLVAEHGVGQIVLGTDDPYPWPVGGVDQVLQTPGLSDADKEAILGGNLIKLLRLQT